MCRIWREEADARGIRVVDAIAVALVVLRLALYASGRARLIESDDNWVIRAQSVGGRASAPARPGRKQRGRRTSLADTRASPPAEEREGEEKAYPPSTFRSNGICPRVSPSA